ncbi:LysR family transcriptional regulator [Paracoccus sp. CPCC 101403]|uniref:LysR family transcriptional regulator n=2 Tax=Paracoccus broussonetiae TaxID=3075834 RepID=A0ABU3EIR1_9RHOB|nr:LysR family transcriptional regulator [Paracoccus sp. CPCC 101403]MDT1064136.1 LysR family transcriptional regulator [Paracoccus sp. CPCC 101403]
MDIRQLRTFVTVARLSSVTKAAEALHITQPAVSGQLKSLEEELQVKLLSRTTSSVTLTQSGEALLSRAEQAIEAFGAFVHQARALRGQVDGQLRIGVVMLDPAALRLGELLHGVVQRHPALRIDVQVGRTSWLLDALRSAEIDGAILVSQTRPPGTKMLVLDEMVFRLVIPARWDQEFDGRSLSQLAEVPWIRVAPRSGHQEIMQDILKDSTIRPIETVEADHEQLMRALVAAGVGVGVLREELALEARAAGEVKFFGDRVATTRLAFVYAEDRADDQAIRAILGELSDIWGLKSAVD